MNDPELRETLRECLPVIRESLTFAEKNIRRMVPLRMLDNFAVKRAIGRFQQLREWLEDEASE